jgi:hypothetical protein
MTDDDRAQSLGFAPSYLGMVCHPVETGSGGSGHTASFLSFVIMRAYAQLAAAQVSPVAVLRMS